MAADFPLVKTTHRAKFTIVGSGESHFLHGGHGEGVTISEHESYVLCRTVLVR